ncbi:MAG: AraC family transcriptional regulator [Coriobacteriales bacterium]|jgi:AraC-like DNA-binding protein|nr:AraC family transcriptional regulator [Coriobacteriales bacterium]
MKDLITDITLFMREHTDRELSIEELANRYGYSKFHFSREFKKAIGVSPNEYWAALKMEQSLSDLERSGSILNAHLKTGYQSTGTFTTSFQKATGFTPGQYQEEIKKLSIWNEVKEYEGRSDKIYTHWSFDKNDPATLQKHRLLVTCQVPDDFRGLLFLGMFPKPMPSGSPVIGKAMTKTGRPFIIDQIPNGEYYALVCAIKGNTNPLTYFLPKYWLRDLDRTPYVFPLEQDTKIELALREIDPTDPAIPLNPVRLLVQAMRAKA